MAYVGVAGMRGLIGQSEVSVRAGCASAYTGGSEGKLAC